MPRSSCQLDHPREDHSCFVKLFSGPCSASLASLEEGPYFLVCEADPVMLMSEKGLCSFMLLVDDLLLLVPRQISWATPVGLLHLCTLELMSLEVCLPFLGSTPLLQLAWLFLWNALLASPLLWLLPPALFEEVTPDASRWSSILSIASVGTLEPLWFVLVCYLPYSPL